MFFKKPTIHKVIQNQLDEARRAQLEHAKLAEWAQGMVKVHEARIHRLRCELQMEPEDKPEHKGFYSGGYVPAPPNPHGTESHGPQ